MAAGTANRLSWIRAGTRSRQPRSTSNSIRHSNGASATRCSPREAKPAVGRSPYCRTSSQENAHGGRETASAVSTYVCPARRGPQALVPTDDAVGSYAGGNLAWAKIDYACNLKAFDDRPVCYKIARFTDGLSNTALVGEKAYDPSVELPTGWHWDEPFFLGGSKGTSRGGVGVVPDRPGTPFKENWGAAHASGAQFAFGDGGVRTLRFDTDLTAVDALLTPDGGEAVTLP